MEAQVSFTGLLVLAVIGTLVVGGIVAVMALLANPKTRAAGAALLVIGFIVVLIGATIIFPMAVGHRRAVSVAQRAEAVRLAEEHQRRAFEMDRHEAETDSPGTIPLEAPADEAPPTTIDAPPPADNETNAETDPEADPEAANGAEQPAEEPSAGAGAPPAEEEPGAVEKRPPWVDKPPQTAGDVYQVAIKTDPRPNRAECESELPGAANLAISAYAETELKRSPQVARQVQLPQTYVRNQIVQQEWPEPVQTSWGKWVQLHALLQFDQEAKQQIQNDCDRVQLRLQEQWQQASVLRRLCYSGTGLATVLLLLSVLFAGLKIDQATDGSYRGRLSLAAVGLVLMVAALAMFAVLSVQRQPIATHPEALTAMPVDPADYALTQADSPVGAAKRVALVAAGLPMALIVLCGMVLLLASKRARPVGLAVLALMLIGGLAVGWSAMRFHGPGPAELLVIAVLVLVPLGVLCTIALFARKTPRNNAGTETPPGGRADVGSGQP